MLPVAFPAADALDTAPLTSRITRADRLPEAQRRGPGRTLRYVVAPAIGAGAVLIGVLALGVGISEEIEAHEPDMVGQLVGMGGVLALMVVAAVLLLVFAVVAAGQRRSPKEQLRLDRFARANSLEYLAGPFSSGHLAWVRARGVGTVRNVVRTRRGRPVELGDFELVTGTSTSRDTRFGGYIAIRLAASLPHIVLTSTRAVRHPATAGAPPAEAQRLSLEGDFDDSFTLYAPAGAERDALYLLTPDVMARLIDRVADWDLEIVGDLLVLTRAKQAVVLDGDDWRRTADTIAAVTTRIERWERWRSADAPARSFGSPSRASTPSSADRLRSTLPRGTKWIYIVSAVFLLLLVVASQIRL